MSVAFSIAIAAVPWFDVLDQEAESLAEQAFQSDGERAVGAAMDASRRRLAQGVDSFVRSLPAVVRNDTNVSRAAAYALVGLADERMLHYPTGGLERWRDRLLEFELYGSALAGQEIVRLARASAGGTGMIGDTGDASVLAPLYLAVLREGFEGSLRGDALGLGTLTASLEETVGAVRGAPADIVTDVAPSRIGLPPMPLAVVGAALWLISGFALWLALPGDALREADRLAARVEAQLPVGDEGFDPLERSIGPSELEPLAASRRASDETPRSGSRDVRGDL